MNAVFSAAMATKRMYAFNYGSSKANVTSDMHEVKDQDLSYFYNMNYGSDMNFISCKTNGSDEINLLDTNGIKGTLSSWSTVKDSHAELSNLIKQYKKTNKSLEENIDLYIKHCTRLTQHMLANSNSVYDVNDEIGVLCLRKCSEQLLLTHPSESTKMKERIDIVKSLHEVLAKIDV